MKALFDRRAMAIARWVIIGSALSSFGCAEDGRSLPRSMDPGERLTFESWDGYYPAPSDGVSPLPGPQRASYVGIDDYQVLAWIHEPTGAWVAEIASDLVVHTMVSVSIAYAPTGDADGSADVLDYVEVLRDSEHLMAEDYANAVAYAAVLNAYTDDSGDVFSPVTWGSSTSAPADPPPPTTADSTQPSATLGVPLGGSLRTQACTGMLGPLFNPPAQGAPLPAAPVNRLAPYWGNPPPTPPPAGEPPPGGGAGPAPSGNPGLASWLFAAYVFYSGTGAIIDAHAGPDPGPTISIRPPENQVRTTNTFRTGTRLTGAQMTLLQQCRAMSPRVAPWRNAAGNDLWTPNGATQQYNPSTRQYGPMQ